MVLSQVNGVVGHRRGVFVRERFRGQVNYEIDKVIRCYRGGEVFVFAILR